MIDGLLPASGYWGLKLGSNMVNPVDMLSVVFGSYMVKAVSAQLLCSSVVFAHVMTRGVFPRFR